MKTNPIDTQLFSVATEDNRNHSQSRKRPAEMDAKAVALRRQYGRDHYRKNREVYLDRMRLRRRDPVTAKKIAEAAKIYQQTPEYKQRRKELYLRHKEKIKANSRAFSKSPRGRQYQNGYKSLRRRTNPQVKLAEWLRTFVNRALWLRETQKQFRRTELIGCTLDQLKAHLESQFEPWMNWNNRDKWHVDHIIPTNSFDLTNPEEQKWCFYFENLRPLERVANLSKSDTIPPILPPWLPPHIAERIKLRSVPQERLRT